MDNARPHRVILASGSPRRRELLEKAGLGFEVVPSPVEEHHDAAMAPGELCELNARLKASDVWSAHREAWVIGADTLVFLDGRPLGKPKDHAEAAAMLRALSARTHEVRTGVCVCSPDGKSRVFHETTRVIFRKLDEAAVQDYLSLVNPLDKAGGYGIQEHGDRIIERIEGLFDNVMGLPVAAVLDALGPAAR